MFVIKPRMVNKFRACGPFSFKHRLFNKQVYCYAFSNPRIATRHSNIGARGRAYSKLDPLAL